MLRFKNMLEKMDDNIEKDIKELYESNEDELYIDLPVLTNDVMEKIEEIFLRLVNDKIVLKVIIRLYKENEFKLLNIEKYHNMGLQFQIVLDHYTYSVEEFKDLDNTLNNYIHELVDDNMSPYEKYIKIYNFVRCYKEYKIVENTTSNIAEVVNNKEKSCVLKYILENEYIDCAGYSVLLYSLLNKVNIESYRFMFEVYEKDGTHLGGHVRVLINIDDSKYNIHGIYVSDPTWDSENSEDNLKYSLLPISSMRDKRYSICEETILFDSSNQTEFSKNINELYNMRIISPELPIEIKGSLKERVVRIITGIDRNEGTLLNKITDADELYKTLCDYIISKNKHTKE